MVKAPGIEVNGIKISIEQINEEVQYHPAENLQEAKEQAMRALVVRELLIQEAVRQGVCDRDGAMAGPDDVIDRLLEKEITVPEADEDVLRHYYNNNKSRFHTAPLFQVSHIFLPALPEDKEEREKSRQKAADILAQIKSDPSLFEKMARAHSACTSAKEGGHLGQVTKGQTVPAFEAAIMAMQAGDLSDEPVETEVGIHIIKVHEREDGRPLPFDSVKSWIADFLKQQSWQRAVSQYVQILAGKAEISGFRMNGAENPLVQ